MTNVCRVHAPGLAPVLTIQEQLTEQNWLPCCQFGHRWCNSQQPQSSTQLSWRYLHGEALLGQIDLFHIAMSWYWHGHVNR